MNKRDIYIGFGSNQGKSVEIIKRAMKMIAKNIGPLRAQSSFYETEPVGFVAADNFVNAIAVFVSDKTPQNIMKSLLSIENEIGRVRSSVQGYESRIIDLDILAIEEETVLEKNLVIPHPRMHERAFVLVPFSEINSEWIHPIEKQTITELLKCLQDNSKVTQILT